MSESEIIKGLLDIATGKIKHDYAGSCPDDLDPEVRDPFCPACQVMILAEDAVEY